MTLLLKKVTSPQSLGSFVKFACSLTGPRHVSPSEFLPVDGAGWEEEVTSLLQNQLLPMGFELHAVTRLPYLCEGDSSQDYYSLDDVVVVLRKPPTNTPAL